MVGRPCSHARRKSRKKGAAAAGCRRAHIRRGPPLARVHPGCQQRKLIWYTTDAAAVFLSWLIHAHKWKMRFATAHLFGRRQNSRNANARRCERGIIARHYFRNFILAEVDVWRSAVQGEARRYWPTLKGLLYFSFELVCVCNSIWAHRRLHGGSFSHSLETPLSAAARI